jgi:pimeloyl-ACP methyl ester carboxylesterase
VKAYISALIAPILIALAAGAAHAVEADSPALRAKAAELVTAHVNIDSDTPGIELYLRNKRPRDWKPSAKRTLLFVHGATYPAETAFDLQLDGLSWMDYIAAHGWDVWLVDVRGYGRSTRPPEMEQSADQNAPIVTTDVAIRDISSAVDYILGTRGLPRLNLMGWSWGTTTMGGYAAANNDKVEKLVLVAPVWLRDTPSQLAGQGPLGAYRTVAKDAAKARWLRGVPEDKVDGLIPPGWFEAWADAHLGDRSQVESVRPAARAERRDPRCDELLVPGQAALRPGQDPRADPDRTRRMGPGHANLHGAGGVQPARECSGAPLRADRRRHPHRHHGTQPHAAVPRSAAVPRGIVLTG